MPIDEKCGPSNGYEWRYDYARSRYAAVTAGTRSPTGRASTRPVFARTNSRAPQRVNRYQEGVWLRGFVFCAVPTRNVSPQRTISKELHDTAPASNSED